MINDIIKKSVRCEQAFYTSGFGTVYAESGEKSETSAFAYICQHCHDTHLAIYTDLRLNTIVSIRPEHAEKLAHQLINPPTLEGIMPDGT